MYVLITVDTEGVHGKSPLDEMVWGRFEGYKGEHGVGLIADICEAYGAEATFFLDVYEHSFYGKSAMKEIATYLCKRGHDVQLHTHPAWYQDSRDNPLIRRMKRESSFFPENKYWMNLNTLEEQIRILHHGKDLLEEWTGKPVIAHRAGGYALNADTIIALREVGIPIDSSMYFGNLNCHCQWSRNQLVRHDGLLEIPVTGFWADVFWGIGAIKVRTSKTFIKTDLDWCHTDELIWFTQEARRLGVRVMNLFLHSYSLAKVINRGIHFYRMKPDPLDRRKLEDFLSYCRGEDDIEILSIRQFWNKFHLDSSLGTDTVPSRRHEVSIISKIRLYW